MKKLLALSFIGSSLLIGSNPAKSELIWGTESYTSGDSQTLGITVYTFDTETNRKGVKATYQFSNDGGSTYINDFQPSTNNYDHIYNSSEGKLIITGINPTSNVVGKYIEYDTNNFTFGDVKEPLAVGDLEFNPTTGWATVSDVTTNSSSITSNTSNISSNDTDIASNSTSITSNTSNISSNDTDISALQSLISTKSGSTTTSRIGDSTKNTLEIGPTTNPTTIDQSGISVSGGNLIKKDSDGNIHIGKNSFVIGDDVLNGAHPIWAEDENGTKIPLNIYGSDLQINGVSVQTQIDTNTSNISTNSSNISTNTSDISTNSSNISTNTSNIKNLGQGVAGSTALTAALTALPQTSKESKLSCGVGTGAYSSRYAVGFGCASKVNERVDVNAGGSYVFGGSKSYGGGTLDSGVVKAGFVFKLGKLNKPTQISMKEKEEFKKEISDLKENNNQIISQNKNLQLENQSIISQNNALLARLERLEKIALGDLKSKDLAVYPLK